MKRLSILALSLVACGGEEPLGDCPTHDQASFQLGTGQVAFEPLADGQSLSITPGTQGGCHFFISLLTDGFADVKFKMSYEVFYADDNTSTGSESSFTVRLRPSETPGTCESVGSTAFLLRPWEMEDRRVTIEVNVEDEEGRTATQRRTVVADWPSTLDPNGCGPR